MNPNVFAPLLSDAELSQINAEREEAAQAATVYLMRSRDGTERLLVSESPDSLMSEFGASDFGGGAIAGWATPAPDRDQPSKRSWVLSDIAVALILVLTIAILVFGVAP